MNKLKIITKDGSPSIYLKGINEYYHSKYGAVSLGYKLFPLLSVYGGPSFVSNIDRNYK